MTTTIIPAAAGYYGLWPADNGRGYGRSPIVAWQVTTDGDSDVTLTEPVIEGSTGPEIAAILCPDGTVNEADGGDWFEAVGDWVRQRAPR
ncbi:hypothetical protein [Bosea minatitlanensis]|uniref:Uncharacterized protein n=1 Tax=Bosea minatitlanensis TaxID=128782 RepID=A0ABW0EZP9_9HYPH|nr:hypothetical protein [Bosea minatitlanensis]MCT4495443.1 hypothetical protein [Bosea minatitlanensis]